MSQRAFGAAKPVKKGCVLVVTGRLAAGHLDKFLELFSPVAAHVAQHEEGCLAYEVSISDDTPDSFVIYERYVSKEYLEQVHWKSEPFKTFKSALGTVQWVEPVSMKVYQELDIGF